MTRVVTHPLPSEKRAGCVVREIVRLYEQRRRVVVWVAADRLRTALDEYLWNYEKLAFVPHIIWSTAMGQIDDPVVLVGEAANPNNAEALVIGDGVPPEEWVAGFDEVHDFISPGDEGLAREQWWLSWREKHS